VLALIGSAVLLLPATGQAAPPSKCITDGTTWRGRSILPDVAQLGARVFTTGVFWSSVATSRPANPQDPADPAYQWPAGLDATLDEARRAPAIQKQLGEAQQALGGLIDEIIGLFKGETAITVRPVGSKNEVTLLVTVDDAEKAKGTLDKLATLVGALTQKTPEPVTVAGQDFKKLAIGKTSLYYGVFDGKLVVTNSEGAITSLVNGPYLADSQAYKDVAEAAGLPDESTGIFYADVPKLVPLIDSLAKSGKNGKPLSPDAKAHLEALSTALFYGSVDGDVLSLKGFVSVR